MTPAQILASEKKAMLAKIEAADGARRQAELELQAKVRAAAEAGAVEIFNSNAACETHDEANLKAMREIERAEAAVTDCPPEAREEAERELQLTIERAADRIASIHAGEILGDLDEVLDTAFKAHEESFNAQDQLDLILEQHLSQRASTDPLDAAFESQESLISRIQAHDDPIESAFAAHMKQRPTIGSF